MSWFGSKKTPPPAPAPKTRSSKPPVDDAVSEDPDRLLDESLDALGALLRTFGKFAFSLEDTTSAQLAERYERWARHVLNNAPPPEGTEAQRGRSWRALQRDFSDRRKAESEHVRRVRDLIWEVMNGVRRALSHDATADARLREPLEKLRRVVNSEATMAELRSEVGAAVAAIEETLAQRQDAQAGEVAGMAAKMLEAKGELLASQGDGEIDPLTQVFTKAPLDRHLENVASFSDFTSEPLSMLIVDGDHFKALNAAVGRGAGDRVLRAVADATVRAAARSTDYVARLGSDEFVIVLGDTAAADAAKVADRIVEAVRKISVPSRPGQAVSVSIGVAQRGRFEVCAAWLARAKVALDSAKQSGRDRVASAQEP